MDLDLVCCLEGMGFFKLQGAVTSESESASSATLEALLQDRIFLAGEWSFRITPYKLENLAHALSSISISSSVLSVQSNWICVSDTSVMNRSVGAIAPEVTELASKVCPVPKSVPWFPPV